MSGGCPIILVADASPEIGWGHAMRTLAVAQALEEYYVPVVWVTNTPEVIRRLGPPCPVMAKTYPNSLSLGLPVSLFVDAPEESLWHTWAAGARNCSKARVVQMVDKDGPPLYETIWRICPHFGSEGWDWGLGAVCTGPRWMPLRRELLMSASGYGSKGRVLGYRCNRPDGEPYETYADVLEMKGGEDWWTCDWSGVLTPAATLAYECMHLDIPVMLVPGVNDAIGQNMVEAGVALWWAKDLDTNDLSRNRDRAMAAVDGGGAERVASLLMAKGTG